MSSQIKQYLIKFPSSKRFLPPNPNEKPSNKMDNSEHSNTINYNDDIKEEISINEHLNINDRNSFSTKIGFMHKKNLSFHSKFEPNEKSKLSSSSKIEDLKTDKLMKKIEILEEENSTLQKINNFSGGMLEESKILKKKLDQYSKEMEEKKTTIDTLNNEISYIKEKFENEYFSDNLKNSEKEEINNEITPRNSAKIFELLNDNKNLSFVVKELSDKYNKNLIKLRNFETEKHLFEEKICLQNKEKDDFKEKMIQLLPHPHDKQTSKAKISYDDLYMLFADFIRNQTDKSYLQVPCSSDKKRNHEQVFNEDFYFQTEKKNFGKDEKMKEKNLNEISSITVEKPKETNNQKFKFNTKENFCLRKPNNSNNSEYMSNLKIYKNKKSVSKTNFKI